MFSSKSKNETETDPVEETGAVEPGACNCVCEASSAPVAGSRNAPSLIIIRNCSTKEELSSLLEKLNGASCVSGRYFIPNEQNLAVIRNVAVANKLFLKESVLRDVLILDLMQDRTFLHRNPR